MSVLNPTRPINKTRTHEGGVGRKSPAKEELALLAVSSFLGDSFYEKGNQTLSRLYSLAKKVPEDYLEKLAVVTRKEFDMRSTPAALMGAYTLIHGQPKDISVFHRGDELGDYLGSVSALSDKKKVTPAAVRTARRVLQNTLTERKALRYARSGRTWNLAKIIRLSHARAGADVKQSALLNFVLQWQATGSLNSAWEQLNQAERKLLPLIEKAVKGEDTGEISWERSRSAGASWNSVVRQMGYFALVRNLNNFFKDEDFNEWEYVTSRLSDSDEVERSQLLPFRFLQAIKAIEGSSHRKYHAVLAALETALEHSLVNFPKLEGSSIIFVDTSGSMNATVSDKSEVTYVDIAALFGAALSLSQGAEVVAFGTKYERISFDKNASLYSRYKSILDPERRFRIGWGTEIWAALQHNVSPTHENVIVFSDMQTMDSRRGGLKHAGTVFSVNLAAYEAQLSTFGEKFYALGGWSDTSLKLITHLSGGRNIVDFVESY